MLPPHLLLLLLLLALPPPLLLLLLAPPPPLLQVRVPLSLSQLILGKIASLQCCAVCAKSNCYGKILLSEQVDC